jgi:hypothetical protein
MLSAFYSSDNPSSDTRLNLYGTEAAVILV